MWGHLNNKKNTYSMLQYNIDLNGKTILVTGAAGLIGSNLVKRLLSDFEPIKVIGIDSITDNYDVRLKQERLKKWFSDFLRRKCFAGQM